MKAGIRFLLLAAWSLAAMADERVSICYNYGCSAQADIVYVQRQLAEIGRLLRLADSPESERALLAQAVGRLYRWAGEQSPVRNDRGRNDNEEDLDGRMDCIDHSTSTTRLLQMIERQGWLKWHRVLAPARRMRFFVVQHFSAVIEEAGAAQEARRFAVDSWFVDNGEPAVILPLESWLQGEGPDVE